MHYVDRLTVEHKLSNELRDRIVDTVALLRDCFAANNKLLLCGNGGSACDCEHIAGELMKGFLSLRPLTAAESQALCSIDSTEGARLAHKLQRALPTIVLTGLGGLSTAFLNDVDGELVFAQQAHAYTQQGDVIWCISTSGNANNVCLAAIAAKAKGATVIGMTGEHGGKLAAYCDILLNAPATETYRVQELHLPIYHAICAQLEAQLFLAQQPD